MLHVSKGKLSKIATYMAMRSLCPITLGFVELRVDSFNGAASVILEMLLKFGVLRYIRTTRHGHFNNLTNSVGCFVLEL
jgi:hypothetical protein